MPESTPTYMPSGLSQILFQGQMAPEISRAQEAFSGGARGLKSAQSKGRLAGWLGNLLLGGLSSGVKKSLLASGHPLMALLADPVMRASGQYIGEKWAGRGEKIENPTELFGEDFDVLRDIRKGMPGVSKGRAAGTFLSSLGSELKSEAGKELFSKLGESKGYIGDKPGFDDATKDLWMSPEGREMWSERERKRMASAEFGPEMPEVYKGFNKLSDLLYSGKNLGESEWTEKPYWWTDPQVAEWSQQGDPSRMMGSQWGYQQGGPIPEYAGGGPVGGLIQYRKGY
jgi:hypothetical protein